MVIDEREIIALFDKNGKLRKELEKDIKAIATRKATVISVNESKNGYSIVFDSGGERDYKDGLSPVKVEDCVAVALHSVKKIPARGRSKYESVKIVFGVSANQTGSSTISQKIEIDIKENDWAKKGLDIIKSKILDFVEDAIKKRFIFS